MSEFIKPTPDFDGQSKKILEHIGNLQQRQTDIQAEVDNLISQKEEVAAYLHTAANVFAFMANEESILELVNAGIVPQAIYDEQVQQMTEFFNNQQGESIEIAQDNDNTIETDETALLAETSDTEIIELKKVEDTKDLEENTSEEKTTETAEKILATPEERYESIMTVLNKIETLFSEHITSNKPLEILDTELQEVLAENRNTQDGRRIDMLLNSVFRYRDYVRTPQGNTINRAYIGAEQFRQYTLFIRDLLASNYKQKNAIELVTLPEIHKKLSTVLEFIPEENSLNPNGYIDSMTSILNSVLLFKKLYPQAQINPSSSQTDVDSKIDLIITLPQKGNNHQPRIFINLKAKGNFRPEIIGIRDLFDIRRFNNDDLEKELFKAFEYFQVNKKTGDMLFFMTAPKIITSERQLDKSVHISRRRIGEYNIVRTPRIPKIDKESQSDVIRIIQAAQQYDLLNESRLGSDIVKARLASELPNNSLPYITAFCLKLVHDHPKLQQLKWTDENGIIPSYWNHYFQPAIEALKRKRGELQEIPDVKKPDIEPVKSDENVTEKAVKEEDMAVIDTEYNSDKVPEESIQIEEKKQLPSVVRHIEKKAGRIREAIEITHSFLKRDEKGRVKVDQEQSSLMLSPNISLERKKTLLAASLQDVTNRFFADQISQKELQSLVIALQRLDSTPDKSLIRTAFAQLGDDLPVILEQLGRSRTANLGYIDIDSCNAERIAGYLRDKTYEIISMRRKIQNTSDVSEKIYFRSKLREIYDTMEEMFEIVRNRCNDYGDGLESYEIQEALLDHFSADLDELPKYLRDMMRILNEEDYGNFEEILDPDTDRLLIHDDFEEWNNRDRLEDPREDIEEKISIKGLHSYTKYDDEYYFPLDSNE